MYTKVARVPVAACRSPLLARWEWTFKAVFIYHHYREQGVTRTITECEGGPRESKAFMSTSHQIEIAVHNRKTADTYFLFKYEGKFVYLKLLGNVNLTDTQ